MIFGLAQLENETWAFALGCGISLPQHLTQGCPCPEEAFKSGQDNISLRER